MKQTDYLQRQYLLGNEINHVQDPFEAEHHLPMTALELVVAGQIEHWGEHCSAVGSVGDFEVGIDPERFEEGIGPEEGIGTAPESKLGGKLGSRPDGG